MQGHILNRKYMNTKKRHEFQHLILVFLIKNNLYKLKSKKHKVKQLFCMKTHFLKISDIQTKNKTDSNMVWRL